MSGKLRVHHLAILVEDIDRARSFWEEGLGLKVGPIQNVPEQDVNIAFLPTENLELELVMPSDPDSKWVEVLRKRGKGMHHICLEVDRLEERLEHLAQRGVRLINPKPILGPEGRRMAFIHPESTSGVLVELYEMQEREEKSRP